MRLGSGAVTASRAMGLSSEAVFAARGEGVGPMRLEPGAAAAVGSVGGRAARGVVHHRSRERALIEVPDASGTGQAIRAVGRPHVTVPVVGTTSRARPTRNDCFGSALEVDDEVVAPGDAVEVFLDDEPSA